MGASVAEQVDLNRLRRQVSVDRLLARLFQEESALWILKGGHALELRFRMARSTVDIDLTLAATAESKPDDTSEALREMLQRAAGIDLQDWFEFTIGPPIMDLNAAPYGGARYPIEARMDQRIFGRFHLDAAIGDVVIQPLESIVCRDWLGFAGIEASKVRMTTREQQLAEKIHAYTLPRNSTNSQVKDLADLALLIGSGGLDEQRARDSLPSHIREAGNTRFAYGVGRAAKDWKLPFRALAKEYGLPIDVYVAFAMVQELWTRSRDGDCQDSFVPQKRSS